MRTSFSYLKSESNTLRRSLLAAGFTGLAAIAGCGEDTSGSVSNSSPSDRSVGSETSEPSKETVEITFDSIGSDLASGGSNVINVYPGTGSEDKTANGTFMDKQTADAECKQEGRLVSSVVEQGEQPVTSTAWLRIENGKYFATAVYIENRDQVLSELPDC